MGRRSFTDRRRAALARKISRLDALEPRAMITESLGILTLGIGVPALLAFVPEKVEGFSATPRPDPPVPGPAPAAPPASDDDAPGGGSAPRDAVMAPTSVPDRVAANPAGDWLTLSKAADSFAPTPRGGTPARGGAGGAAIGGGTNNYGLGGTNSRGAITPLSVAAPASNSQSPSSAPVVFPGSVSPTQQAPAAASAAHTAATPAATAGAGATASGIATAPAGGFVGGGASSGGHVPSTVGVNAIPGVGPALMSFPYFTMYTVDENDGTVLFPGAVQFGTFGGAVDLRAQVGGATVSSYAWSYSGGDIDPLTVTSPNPYQLQFDWVSSGVGFGPYYTDAVSLEVTDTNGHVQDQTYTFVLANATGTATATTWPESLPPDQVLAGTDSVASHNVSVASVSGAVDATIPLPSYNPNVPALALTYDSLAADPRPIVVEHHTIDPSLAEPTQVSAQLTLNGVAGTTYYYDASTLNPGDIQQIALQGQSGLATGRYAYSLAIGDVRGTTTTTNVTGSADVINDSASALGDGWTLAGLERVIPETGGVILDLGGGGLSLWFSGSPGSGGGTYTDPAGEFSTLAKNSGGSYTDTLTDGTKINFDATTGLETSSVDRNGLRTTFAYSSGNLSTITDPYSKVTTFTYTSGELSAVTDPAGRVATFTHSGSSLTGVTLPDSSTWGYGYDGSGRLTHVTDPNSRIATVAYDAAERASTITRPDGSAEKFVADQEAGWTNSGTALSPAAATLLAQAASSYTDPLGNVTQSYPDWRGQGLTNQSVDALGDVTTADRDANGLATITIDQDNRVTQTSYDGSGNPVTITYPGLNTDHYTYNGFSEPLTHTDGNGHTTSYTYDGNGNLTVVQDPLLNRTTMTYTGDGMLATSKDANSHTTSYAYDAQDRLTTVTNPDSSTDLAAYDTKGNATTITDERGNVTVTSYDALNRTTGTTDALGDRTTYVYDPAGNPTAVQAPLSRTTSYAYDSMNRVTTITDPLGHATVLGYDSGGNQTTSTDTLGRVTTTVYDALDRPTVVIDPLGRRTTTTYDPASQTTQVKDPLSGVTAYNYSGNGWLNTSVDSLGATTTYTYSGTGKVLTVSEPPGSGGLVVQYAYDADDRQTAVTDELGHTTTTTYDAVGNVIASTDANSHTTSYAYDSRNRQTTVTDPLGHTTVTGYDSGGNPITVTDGLGHTTTTAYDALDRATTVTDPLGDVTKYVYDSGGRQTVVVDPNGNRTTFAYDAADRLTTQTNPNGATETFVYDNDGELTDKTDFDGRRTTYTYDSGGRQTGETWVGASPAERVTYTYDNNDNLTGAADANAMLTFTYDSGGNPLTAATSGSAGQPSVTLTSTYNALNQRATLADNLASPATTTFGYDVAHRLVTITRSAGNLEVDFGYDAANNLTSLTRPTGSGVSVASLTTSYAYDAANRLTTLTDQFNGFASGGSGGHFTTPLATYLYGYDSADRLTTEVNAEGTVTYSYDNSDQLTGAAGSRTETYTYDSGGNRTLTGYTTSAGNETTASPGATYAYDNEGNLVGQTNTSSHAVTTYTYDYRDRLVGAIQKSSGGTTLMQATFAYDAMDRRIETDETVSGVEAKTFTVYDGDNPYADFAPAGGSGGGVVLKDRYLYGPAVDQILARTDSGGSTAWYLTDRMETVRDIVSFTLSSPTVLDHVAYDSYGTVLSETSPSNGDRFKYAGMQYDTATGLDYDRARWFDATIGIFMSADPKGFVAGDSNLYRYVGNGPTNETDPAGLAPQGPGNSMITPNPDVTRAFQESAERQTKLDEALRELAEAKRRAQDALSQALAGLGMKNFSKIFDQLPDIPTTINTSEIQHLLVPKLFSLSTVPNFSQLMAPQIPPALPESHSRFPGLFGILPSWRQTLASQSQGNTTFEEHANFSNHSVGLTSTLTNVNPNLTLSTSVSTTYFANNAVQSGMTFSLSRINLPGAGSMNLSAGFSVQYNPSSNTPHLHGGASEGMGLQLIWYPHYTPNTSRPK